ncbi:Albumin-2 [Bienertia sinuspersici]
MKNEVVIEDYAPDTATNDTIVYGPCHIGEAFSSLKDTIFEEQGIDCAFASSEEGVAYIFSGNKCAKWFYAPDDSSDDEIRDGPMPIAEMFPFLKRTMFEKGVDAALESSGPYEAYLFKGKYYARINYNPENKDHRRTNISTIHDYWPCLRNTTYENGFDGAFGYQIYRGCNQSRVEAYLFKKDSYARIVFTPGSTTNEQLKWSKRIKQGWPNLGRILPRTNRRLVAN